MLKKVAILFLVVLGTNSICFSQATNDGGLWMTFNIEKKLKHNVGLFLTEECRLRENYTRLNLFYTDIGVSIQPFKILKISLAYRSIDKFQIDNTFSFRHRAMLDIVVKKKVKMLVLSYRQRIQAEVRDVYISEDGGLPEWYSRNKFEIKLDLDKKITPYISTEFRFQINNPRAVEVNHLWHRNRYCIGIDYQKNKRDKFGLYYLVQNEFNVSAPQNLYIVGIEYSISL